MKSYLPFCIPGAKVIQLFTAVIYHHYIVILSFCVIKLYCPKNHSGNGSKFPRDFNPTKSRLRLAPGNFDFCADQKILFMNEMKQNKIHFKLKDWVQKIFQTFWPNFGKVKTKVAKNFIHFAWHRGKWAIVSLVGSSLLWYNTGCK